MRRSLLATALLLALVPAATAEAAPKAQAAIVNGDAAPAGAYLWQVGVLPDGFLCGGTLIAPRRVVTAAHCVEDLSPREVTVVLGTQMLARAGDDAPGTDMTASDIAIHEGYEAATLENDLAIIELASDAPTETTDAIGVAEPEDPLTPDPWWDAGSILHISGWGAMQPLAPGQPPGDGDFDAALRVAQVPRLSDDADDCAPAFAATDPPTFFASASMFCAGGDTIDACAGDSGGPIAAPDPLQGVDPTDPSRWRLVGATSWGLGCAQPQYAGVYTRLAAPGLRALTQAAPGDLTYTPYSVGEPSISGTFAPGHTLTCDPGTWAHEPTLAYRFRRGGSTVSAGQTYTIRSTDVGRQFTCRVTGTNATGRSFAESDPSPAVVDPTATTPPPAVTVPPIVQPDPQQPVQPEQPDETVEDLLPPTSRPGRTMCRRRACRLIVRTRDEGGSGVVELRTRMIWTVRRPCTRGGRRMVCTRVKSKGITVKRRSRTRWLVRTGRLEPRRYALRISAVDAAGNPQRRTSIVRFRVRR